MAEQEGHHEVHQPEPPLAWSPRPAPTTKAPGSRAITAMRQHPVQVTSRRRSAASNRRNGVARSATPNQLSHTPSTPPPHTAARAYRPATSPTGGSTVPRPRSGSRPWPGRGLSSQTATGRSVLPHWPRLRGPRSGPAPGGGQGHAKQEEGRLPQLDDGVGGPVQPARPGCWWRADGGDRGVQHGSQAAVTNRSAATPTSNATPTTHASHITGAGRAKAARLHPR